MPLPTNGRFDQDDERAHLLRTYNESDDENDCNNHRQEPSTPTKSPSPSSARRRRRLGIVAVCLLLIIIIELGAYLTLIPLTQVLEDIICTRFYPDRQAGDLRCKSTAVQTELSFIRGWQTTLDFLPGVLTAIPYGLLADRRGREMVLCLSLLGITLSSGFYIVVCSHPVILPPRLTWLSAIFTFIGGGQTVCNAMIFTILNDVVTESQRSTSFFYLAAAVILGELLASPVVYFLLGHDQVWPSIYLGFGCLAFGTATAFFLPETLTKSMSKSNSKSKSPAPAPPPTDPNPNPPPPIPGNPSKSTLQTILTTVRYTLPSTPFHFATLLLLLLTYLFTTLGRFSQELLFQYVTKRYHVTYSTASLLLSVRAFFTLILFAVLLPSASYLLLNRWRMTPVGKDLWLARGSAVCLMVGAVGVGVAGSWGGLVVGVGFFALGGGYNMVVRSLLAGVVGDGDGGREGGGVGMLYTAIGVMETLGALVAGPVLAYEFRVGMEWEGGWIGLPYLSAGGLFAVAVVVTGLVRVGGEGEERMVVGEGGRGEGEGETGSGLGRTG